MIFFIPTLIIFFILGIVLQKKFSRLCAICFAVLSTWLLGLVMPVIPNNSVFIDPVLLAILMGGSAVGGMYYFSSLTSETLHVFRFPYLITAFVAIYIIIQKQIDVTALFVLLGLWMLFFTFYLLRNNHTKHWFKKIIACCRDW